MVPPFSITSFTAKGYIRAIDRLRVDMVTSVPTMLALVMRETKELAKADLGCVTMAVTGSAPATAEFFEQMQLLFPNAETAAGARRSRVRWASARTPTDLASRWARSAIRARASI
jgi:hypothetical protein